VLLLSRKQGESIKIGHDVEIFVTRIYGSRVTIGVAAPKECHVIRSEIERKPRNQDESNGSADQGS
jgi:carbon storage regulator